MDVVETALIDERVEVRSKAGQVLSGLLHCAFVDKARQDSLLVTKNIEKNLAASTAYHFVCRNHFTPKFAPNVA